MSVELRRGRREGSSHATTPLQTPWDMSEWMNNIVEQQMEGMLEERRVWLQIGRVIEMQGGSTARVRPKG